MRLRATLALAVALRLVLTAIPASALSASPTESLTNPDRYDGQAVTIRGTVTKRSPGVAIRTTRSI